MLSQFSIAIEEAPVTVKAISIVRTFYVEFNNHQYTVIRRESSYNDWQGAHWVVNSHGFNKTISCDPDKPTHKKVVAYVKSTQGFGE